MEGKPIKGLFIRDGKFHVGYSKHGRWHLVRIKATSLDQARVERDRFLKQEGLLARFEVRRPKEPKLKQLDQLHSESRKLAQSISQAKLLLAHRENRALLDEAELLAARMAELIYDAWRTSRA
jgi:hypothetical protein